MILTRSEIDRQVRAGVIRIEPYDPGRLNPVSYNYSLGSQILEAPAQDALPDDDLPPTEIPAAGYLIFPDKLYLANTAEVIGSDEYVVSLIGRSSIGRLGLFVQLAADLGNLGAIHRWTLELHCVQPLIVYPGMTIGQVSFWRPSGERIRYSGRYSDQSRPTPNLNPRLEM